MRTHVRWEASPVERVALACGCFTIVTATLGEYDAAAGHVFAAGHPLDEERAAATEAFERAKSH